MWQVHFDLGGRGGAGGAGLKLTVVELRLSTHSKEPYFDLAGVLFPIDGGICVDSLMRFC
jgi:hypothetical protein